MHQSLRFIVFVGAVVLYADPAAACVTDADCAKPTPTCEYPSTAQDPNACSMGGVCVIGPSLCNPDLRVCGCDGEWYPDCGAAGKVNTHFVTGDAGSMSGGTACLSCNLCPPGHKAVQKTNISGLIGILCEPISYQCPDIPGYNSTTCPPNLTPYDQNNDGCADACLPAQEPECDTVFCCLSVSWIGIGGDGCWECTF